MLNTNKSLAKTATSVLLFWLGTAAFGQESCCMDREFAAAFMPHAILSKELPADLPFRVEHPELELIGVMRSSFATNVAWKSKLNPEQAAQAVERSLLEQQWTLLVEPKTEAALRSGFVRSSPLWDKTTKQFCRRAKDSLRVFANNSEVGTVVRIWDRTNFVAGECNKDSGVGGWRPENRRQSKRKEQIMPTLLLPERATPSPLEYGRSSEGGNYSTSYFRLVSDASPSAVLSDFEAQLIDQGWNLESRKDEHEASEQRWRKKASWATFKLDLSAIKTSEFVELTMEVKPL